jgi:hypothetical protein
MGADLITYMLVGPNKLVDDPKKREKAILHASRMIAAVTAWQTLHNEHWNNGEVEGEIEIPATLIRELKHFGINPTTCDIEDYNSGVVGVDATEAVDELIELWNGVGHYRDVSTRGYRTRQILVAGDMSWGDEPSGRGYQTCKQSERLGLLRFYGIE